MLKLKLQSFGHLMRRTYLFEKTLNLGKIEVHSEGDQPWVFFGRNDAKAKTPVLWPPYAKS